MYRGRSGGLIYTISVVGDKLATLLSCNDETNFDTKIKVFQDSVEGSCVAGNDDACGLRSRVTFDAVETETYIIIVTGWDSLEGTFTLLV